MISLQTQDGILEALAYVRGTTLRYRGKVRQSPPPNAIRILTQFCNDVGNFDTFSREQFRTWWNDEF